MNRTLLNNRIVLGVASLVMLLVACAPDQETEYYEIALSRTISKGGTYANYTFEAIHQEIFTGLKNNEIKAYSDPNFSYSFNHDEIMDMMLYEELISIYPDPENPYLVKDSVIETTMLPEDVKNYRIVESFYPDPDKQNVYHSEIEGVAFMHNPLVEKRKFSERPLAYFTYDDLHAFLGDEKFHALQIMMLNRISNTGHDEGISVSRFIETMPDDHVGPKTIEEWNRSFLNKITEAKLQTFKDPAFSEPVQADAADEFLYIEEIRNISPDPQRPEYRVQHTEKFEMDITNIRGFRIVEAITIDENNPAKYTAEIKGLAPVLVKDRHPSPSLRKELFWIPYSEIKNVYGDHVIVHLNTYLYQWFDPNP